MPGRYPAPAGGAVVRSIEEETQVRAPDRTRPVLPAIFAAIEKRTPDYVRHCPHSFAALYVTTGEVLAEVRLVRTNMKKPDRNSSK
ncbi:hypothetical protein ACH4GP_37925 [Streptomyces celluloflavus]|uniref:Nudix hydrolase domain-containing protein n=1 Tax=Streptomyces celluloflavus TaxID=58344 RepID=A0ABW7RSF4_9ACTN